MSICLVQKTYPFTKENMDILFKNARNQNYYRENLKATEIKILNEENINKIAKFVTVMFLTLFLINNTVYGADQQSKLVDMWIQILKKTQYIAYVVFVYKALETVIKSAIQENLQSAWKKIIELVMGFLLFKFIPDIFQAINNM